MKSSLIAILLLFTNTGHAQQNNVDSIKQLLLRGKQDTARVLLLNNLASYFLGSKPDTALYLAQQGLGQARKIQFVRGEANSLNTIGNVFWITGNYPKALETHLQALKLREGINDKEGMGSSYLNLGNIFSIQGDYKQALYYTFKAKFIFDVTHNDGALCSDLINLGDIYEKSNQLDSARFYSQQAYEIAVRFNYPSGRGVVLGNLGNIYTKMGQPALGMDYYRLSLPDLAVEDYDESICEVTLGMANIYLKKQARKILRCITPANLWLWQNRVVSR